MLTRLDKTVESRANRQYTQVHVLVWMRNPIAVRATHGQPLVYIEQVAVLVGSREDDPVFISALDHMFVGHDGRNKCLAVIAEFEKETSSNRALS